MLTGGECRFSFNSESVEKFSEVGNVVFRIMTAKMGFQAKNRLKVDRGGECRFLFNDNKSGYMLRDGECRFLYNDNKSGYMLRNGECRFLYNDNKSGYMLRNGECRFFI